MESKIIQILAVCGIFLQVNPVFGGMPSYNKGSSEVPKLPVAKPKPKPYSFMYDVKDVKGNSHGRSEAVDASGKLSGNYKISLNSGLVRDVSYTSSDKTGFNVIIKTNEPGILAANPANVKVILLPAKMAPKEPTVKPTQKPSPKKVTKPAAAAHDPHYKPSRKSGYHYYSYGPNFGEDYHHHHHHNPSVYETIKHY